MEWGEKGRQTQVVLKTVNTLWEKKERKKERKKESKHKQFSTGRIRKRENVLRNIKTERERGKN